MVLLRMIGGLGNQMSQVAYAYILAKKRNQQLYIDTSAYKKYKIRPCSINRMELSEDISLENLNIHGINYLWMRMCQKTYHLFYHFLCKRKPAGEKLFLKLTRKGHYYSFDSDGYSYPDCSKENIDVYGYFQAESLYRDHKELIRKIFSVNPDCIGSMAQRYEAAIMGSNCPVSISLRLQDDYTNNLLLNVCTREYFAESIKMILQKNPDADFFVFADDIQRAKEYGLPTRVTYLENLSDVEGMYLMQKCRHFIISNSSFSWWGAYLGEASDKVVMAPDRWANNSKDYSSKYYENVVKVKC